MVIALIVFGAVITHLFHTHRRAAWLLLAGVLLWIGSLGIEIWGRQLIVQPNTPVSFYHKLLIGEEFFEFIGATLIAGALWHAVRKSIRQHVRVEK